KKLRQLGRALLGFNTIAFSPDGKALASAGTDGTVRVWDPAAGREVFTLRGHRDPVNGVAFSPDGKLLASGGGSERFPKDCTVRLWDTATGELLHRLAGHRGMVYSVAFSPDGKLL